jgi:hypothetical protein
MFVGHGFSRAVNRFFSSGVSTPEVRESTFSAASLAAELLILQFSHRLCSPGLRMPDPSNQDSTPTRSAGEIMPRIGDNRFAVK